MKFERLSDAIRYYAYSPDNLSDIAPYGDLASEIVKVPGNIAFLRPATPGVVIYGQSIWGIGEIIDIAKPII